MEKKNFENSHQWLERELNKLRPSHYDGTFFAIAHLRNDRTGESIDIVVPVDKYANEDTKFEFEAIRVRDLAAQCPWDMSDTLVDMDTGVTAMCGQNLFDMIDNSVINEQLSELNNKRMRDVGVYKTNFGG